MNSQAKKAGSAGKGRSATVKLVYAALCVSLCVVLPQAFHMIPDFGEIFSPIHMPVLLCGLLCGWKYGLGCGLVGPLLSALCTGMPSIAALPAMMIECGVYGLTSGLLAGRLPVKNTLARLYASLIPAMLCGRIAAGLALSLIFSRGTLTFPAWFSAYFVKSLPGIAAQLILLPAIVFALSKARLAPPDFYPKKTDN